MCVPHGNMSKMSDSFTFKYDVYMACRVAMARSLLSTENSKFTDTEDKTPQIFTSHTNVDATIVPVLVGPPVSSSASGLFSSLPFHSMRASKKNASFDGVVSYDTLSMFCDM